MLAKLFAEKSLRLTTPAVDLALDYDAVVDHSISASGYAISLGVTPKQLEGDIFTIIELLGGDGAGQDAKDFLGEGIADVMSFIHFETGQIKLGDMVSFSYDDIRLVYEQAAKGDKEKEEANKGDTGYDDTDNSETLLTKRNTCIEVRGGLMFDVDVSDLLGEGASVPELNFAGLLRINVGNMGFAPISFVPDEQSVVLPKSLTIPLFGLEDDLTITPDIEGLNFVSRGSGKDKHALVTFSGTLLITGGPSWMQPANNEPLKLPLVLSAKQVDGVRRLALTTPLFIQALSLDLAEILGTAADLGELGLSLGNLNLLVSSGHSNNGDQGKATCSGSIECHWRLPSVLNDVLPIEPFVVFDSNRAEQTTFKMRLNFSESGLTVDLLSSPLAPAEFAGFEFYSETRRNTYNESCLWWVMKSHQFGHIEFTSPKFVSDGSGAMRGSGSYKILEPLSLPLSLLKDLLANVGLGAVGELLPNSVALPIQSEGKDLKLGLDSFGVLGELMDDALGAVGLDIDAFKALLPDWLEHFFTISLPSQCDYHFNIDSKGSCTGGITLAEGETLKLLLPAGPALYGIELNSFSLGQYQAGKMGVLEADGTIDLFLLPEIVASMAASAAKVPMLPPSSSLITQLKFENLLALVDLNTKSIQPVFFDDISLSRTGVEGFELVSQWHFPKPTVDALQLAHTITPLIDFVTTKEALLESNADDSPFDTYFEIGENYLQLPEYLGGVILGKKGGSIERFEAKELWPFVANSLNFIKTGQVEHLLAAMPIEYRIGSQDVSFFGLADIQVNYLLSSPDELADVGFQKLQLKGEDQTRALSVLPKSIVNGQEEGNGLVTLLRGEVDLSDAMKMSTTFGFAMSEQGVHSGFNASGQLAQLFAIDIKGAVALNTEPKASIMLEGATSLRVADHQVMFGSVSIQNDNLRITGGLDLFPYLPQVNMSAFIEGELSSSDFSLNGQLIFSLFGNSLLKGDLVIAPDRATLDASILGKNQRFGIAEHRGGVKLSGLVFNSFELVNTVANVALSLDEQALNFDGTSRLALPSRKVLKYPVAYAEMDFDGDMRLADGVVKINGKVNNNSYVLAGECKLKGEFAYYAWFNDERSGDFVFSLGGYHPKYSKPAHYPSVSRLEFGWKISRNLSIKGDMYAALTPSCIMAGGMLKASFETGPLEAGFKAKTDFIMAWQPFYYEAELSVDVYASVELRVDFGLFTASVEFSTSIGADLSIWGPDFAGKARIDWDIYEFSIGFGPKKNQNTAGISWGDFKDQYIPSLSSPEFVDLSIESGQIGSIDAWKVVDPDQLELRCQSPIPVNMLALKSSDREASNRDYVEQGDAFNLAPVKAQKITDWEIDILYKVSNDPDFTSLKKGMYFEGDSLSKNFPKAIWGKDFIPKLETQSHSTISLLNGARIVAANGKPPGFTEALDADEFKYQDIVENDPYWQWGSALKPLVPKHDATNIQSITDSLTSAEVAIKRANIAQLFDSDVEMDVTPLHRDIQSAFIGVPQVYDR
ncbi:hypothetical protein BS333_15220 [Vibrio azureus]|uniref:DUF6603 domain-containing protein n=1 Tax=Vibrio azureus NBRC 104587 TaxID=1219077 RepID=U3AS56_9VIBR|nr:DUF6603 domain-containing protein [Vibrio azureus]AUI87751.1 hypothetical protein BS333_15220 [Vibrio azureus]GAD76595.1 hypothetical protein VAZ01S_048_00010 [Vibrio azureus NBRC 104587]